MTSPSDNQNNVNENKPSEKELNFRALEAKYQRQLEQERSEKERLMQELQSKSAVQEEDDDEPYVNSKKLNKTLNQFGQSTQSEIQKAMEKAKVSAKEELKQEMWLENNSDFYDVLQHADKLAELAPQLANSILKMPDGFERQKLVYQNIKALGVDKPKQKEQSVQDKIDANRRGPFYQPTNVSSAPYGQQGDFSSAGKKNAYDQLQALKARLRLS